MTTITKERIELFIKNPLDNGLTRGEQMELARIALASLEAEPIGFRCRRNDNLGDWSYVYHREPDDFERKHLVIEGIYAAPPAPVVPEEATPENVEMLSGYVSTYKLTDSERDIAAEIWNACRAAMLQSGNFRENKNSSTNNFREIAETSTNYPAIPSEVLSAILKVARIRADFDDFDGDRRGIGDCLDEAEQELIVTINKYASQLAAEPIAPNDVREQTAIPQVPVTPDGWISCSERMPEMGERQCYVLAADFKNNYPPSIPNTQVGVYGDWFNDGKPTWDDGGGEDLYLKEVTHWMPLPEPPQEVNQ
ncbi:hypothetical protein A31O_02660 [Escherichia coli KTE170]|nr:DUF551 domain-containing protein [Escherichia coli]EOW68644.1 hypothetical protein A31O_02660 [Escherichia coli KTE170]EOW74943.1 hypothetical protein G434_00975 [Escherichia sp. KTE172]EOX05783.1 hypothetical protein A17O_03311 [Escherichia coli KTE225]EIY8185344.1 DUF551 domain-containing protein [Escherichia coli]